MTHSRPLQEHTDSNARREKALDWLTALLPLFIMSVVYYRWQAVVLELLAVAGYLAVAYLLAPTGALAFSLFPALLTGLVTAFCLPATAPWWPAALAGVVAALAAAVPGLLARRWPNGPYSQPLVLPPLVGYLLVRFLFPGAVGAFTMPAQWSSVDGLSVATPLAVFRGVEAHYDLDHLFFGLHAGSLGEGCVAAILLGALFLLLRRRLRLIAPAAMLATVALFGWIFWNSPLYCLLAGGVALGALLLADREYAPAPWGEQALAGLLVGAILMVLRRFAGIDGTAVALVAVGLARPALPFAAAGLARCFGWLASRVGAGLAWLWGRICRLVGIAGRWLWGRCCALFTLLKEKFCKKQNNG